MHTKKTWYCIFKLVLFFASQESGSEDLAALIKNTGDVDGEAFLSALKTFDKDLLKLAVFREPFLGLEAALVRNTPCMNPFPL